MIRNYLTIALRNFWKHKSFSLINVIGLTLGITCSILILLWVQDEVRYDQFHAAGDRIYRLMNNDAFPDGTISTGWNAPYPFKEVLETSFPEVERATLVTWQNAVLFTAGDRHFQEKGYYASADFFRMFTFPLLQGDADMALQDIHSVAISAELAARLFGEGWQQQDIVGEAVEVDHEHFTIGGVFEELPRQSTLQFDFILPMAWNIQRYPWNSEWGNSNHQLFVELREGTDAQAFNQKMDRFFENKMEQRDYKTTYFLFPFTDLYLHGSFSNGENVGGRIEYVRTFSVVAVLVLILACINFMNLMTARSSRRAKEVGIRKTVGARKQSLVMQFMGEALLITLLSLVLAILLTQLLLPVFNTFTGKQLAIDYSRGSYWLAAIGLALVTSLLAGSYPAFFVASFSPVKVLKGNLNRTFNAVALRKGLVVVQFALSIIMITGTLIVHRQIHYILHKNLGMDQENFVEFDLPGEAGQHYATIKTTLLQQPSILAVTAANQGPLQIGSSMTGARWGGMQAGDVIEFSHIWVDYDFVKTMGMQLAAGRDFSPAIASDSNNFLINETAAKAMGLEHPVGTSMEAFGKKGEIVGVVKDFHDQPLYGTITPLLIVLDEGHSNLFVRIASGKTQEAMAALRQVHDAYSADYPFTYTFFDETYSQLYQSELVMGQLTNYFAFLAIVISCLGLFGLASFTVEQRTKEMGIRKVLGASAVSLLLLLSGSYVRLILLAFMVAVPVANYFLTGWLRNFAYKTEVEWWLYAIPGLLILLIALITISQQTIKAVTTNPVKSLRYE